MENGRALEQIDRTHKLIELGVSSLVGPLTYRSILSIRNDSDDWSDRAVQNRFDHVKTRVLDNFAHIQSKNAVPKDVTVCRVNAVYLACRRDRHDNLAEAKCITGEGGSYVFSCTITGVGP